MKRADLERWSLATQGKTGGGYVLQMPRHWRAGYEVERGANLGEVQVEACKLGSAQQLDEHRQLRRLWL